MSGCLEYTINETANHELGATWNSTRYLERDAKDFISALVAFVTGGTSFVLNVLVFITLFISKELRQNTHYNLVLCLSLSDLVLGLSMCVGGFRLFTPRWATFYAPCVMTSVMFISGITLSFFQTFLISFHRFLKLSDTDLDQVLLKENRKYVTYILIWLIVLGFNISMVHFRHHTEKLLFCKFKCVFGSRYPIMAIYFQTATILLLSLTIIFYCLTIHQVRQRYRRTFAWHAHQRNPTSNDPNSNELTPPSYVGGEQMTLQMKKKIFGSMKLIGFIICALLICTCPMVIASFFDPSQKVLFVVATLACFNSVINPFIYVFNIEKLRREWKNIWQIIKVF